MINDITLYILKSIIKMKKEIKRIDVNSSAKVGAYLSGFFGLIYGFVISLFFLFNPSIIGFGILIVIFSVFACAIIGAIFGALYAILYNFGSKKFGGIKLEFK